MDVDINDNEDDDIDDDDGDDSDARRRRRLQRTLCKGDGQLAVGVPLKRSCSWCLQAPGYSVVIKKNVLDAYEWPSGNVWRELIQQGIF